MGDNSSDSKDKRALAVLASHPYLQDTCPLDYLACVGNDEKERSWLNYRNCRVTCNDNPSGDCWQRWALWHVNSDHPPIVSNCPINERTDDGHYVGRCWFHLADGKTCSRHGDVSKAVEKYQATGMLTKEE